MTTRRALERWLVGARCNHPLRGRAIPAEHLDALDRLLAAIDVADPIRVASKRKAFRELTSESQLADQRAELLIASMLARVGVKFEFGKTAPDLVLATNALGIEVTCRISGEPSEATDPHLGIDLTEHFAGVESAIGGKVEDKAHQGAAMPTILMLNLDRAGWSWLRSPRMWASRIEEIVEAQNAFAGVGIVFSSWDTDYTTSGSLVVKDAAVLEPDLSELTFAIDLRP